MKTPDAVKLGEIVTIAINKAKKHKRTATSVEVGGYAESAQLNVAYELQREGYRVYFNRDREHRVILNVEFKGEKNGL